MEAERAELVASLRPFALIPLYAHQKVPAWEDWPTVAPMGPEQVLQHLEGSCPCKSCDKETGGGNFGIRTGHQPRGVHVEQEVIVIDADSPKTSSSLELPETWAVTTGGGGLHFYFRAPPELFVRNTDTALGAGIQVKGDGSLVVAPGSVHPTGELYRWTPGMDPASVPLADLPEHLLEKVSRAKASPQQGVMAAKPKLPPTTSGLDPLQQWPGVREGQRGDMLARAAVAAIKANVGTGGAYKSLEKLNTRCDPPVDGKRLKRTFESVLERDKKRYPGKYEDSRRVVFLGDNLKDAVDEAEAAVAELLPAGSEMALYQHGGALVQIIRGDLGQPRIQPVTSPALKERLSSAARFRTDPPQRRGAGLPPPEIVASLLARGQWAKFARLQGVCQAPFMRPDGSLALEPGYDASSGVLALYDMPQSLHLNGKSCSLEDAQEAISKLSDPLCDFPFVTPHDRAAALALPLTILGRQAIRGEVPLFALRAHASRSGKGMLAKCLVIQGTGNRPAMGMPAGDADEIRKRLFAAALCGDRTLVLDNEEGVFGCTPLSAAITSGTIEDRILGQSRMVRVPWRCVPIVTGNNLTFRHDQAPRTLIVDIDPQVESPEHRQGFKYPDVVGYLEDHAAEYIMAGLTVLRAHVEAGRPVIDERTFGGFESWNLVVRQAMLWAGELDPLATQGRIIAAEEDLDRAMHRRLLVLWHAVHGRHKLTSRQLIETDHQDFQDALADIVDGPLCSRTVGYALRRLKGRILGGLRINSTMSGGGRVQKWRVDSEPNPWVPQD